MIMVLWLLPDPLWRPRHHDHRGARAGRARRGLVYPDVLGNVAATILQQLGDVGAALAAAPHVLEFRLDIERSASMPLEGRGEYGRWDEADGSLRVYTSTQTSTSVRAAIATKLRLPQGKVEVVAPDVGGGFGVKIMHPWPEEVLVPCGPPADREVKRTAEARALHPGRARAGTGPPRPGRVRRRRAHPWSGTCGSCTTTVPTRRTAASCRSSLDPATRPVQARRVPGGVPESLPEHGHRHAVPRCRPAAGGPLHGARDRPRRGRARPAHRDAIPPPSRCYDATVRTTVVLDDDVRAAVDRLRQERSLGLSAAVNELIRVGLRTRQGRSQFRQQTHAMGLRIDVANVAEALDVLDGAAIR